MSDGSYSILLTFLSLQTQYTVRNVGVFQFSTQNISWHRLCHRAFSEGKRKRNNIYCVRSMCMCAQYSQFHTFNTCTMCLVFVGWSFCSSNFFSIIIQQMNKVMFMHTQPPLPSNGAFLYWFSPFVFFFCSVQLSSV